MWGDPQAWAVLRTPQRPGGGCRGHLERSSRRPGLRRSVAERRPGWRGVRAAAPRRHEVLRPSPQLWEQRPFNLQESRWRGRTEEEEVVEAATTRTSRAPLPLRKAAGEEEEGAAHAPRSSPVVPGRARCEDGRPSTGHTVATTRTSRALLPLRKALGEEEEGAHAPRSSPVVPGRARFADGRPSTGHTVATTRTIRAPEAAGEEEEEEAALALCRHCERC